MDESLDQRSKQLLNQVAILEWSEVSKPWCTSHKRRSLHSAWPYIRRIDRSDYHANERPAQTPSSSAQRDTVSKTSWHEADQGYTNQIRDYGGLDTSRPFDRALFQDVLMSQIVTFVIPLRPPFFPKIFRARRYDPHGPAHFLYTVSAHFLSSKTYRWPVYGPFTSVCSPRSQPGRHQCRRTEPPY